MEAAQRMHGKKQKVQSDTSFRFCGNAFASSGPHASGTCYHPKCRTFWVPTIFEELVEELGFHEDFVAQGVLRAAVKRNEAKR